MARSRACNVWITLWHSSCGLKWCTQPKQNLSLFCTNNHPQPYKGHALTLSCKAQIKYYCHLASPPDRYCSIQIKRSANFFFFQKRPVTDFEAPKLCPRSPTPILEPQNPWIHEFYVVQKRCAGDFKAPPKLWKCSSGGEASAGHVHIENRASESRRSLESPT